MEKKKHLHLLVILAVTIVSAVLHFSCTDEERGTEQISLNYSDSLKVEFPSKLHLIIKDSTSNLRNYPTQFDLVNSDEEDSINIRYSYSQSSYWTAPAFRLKKAYIQDTIVLYFDFVLFDDKALQKSQASNFVNSVNTSPLPNTYSIDNLTIVNKNVDELTVLNRLQRN